MCCVDRTTLETLVGRVKDADDIPIMIGCTARDGHKVAGIKVSEWVWHFSISVSARSVNFFCEMSDTDGTSSGERLSNNSSKKHEADSSGDTKLCCGGHEESARVARQRSKKTRPKSI